MPTTNGSIAGDELPATPDPQPFVEGLSRLHAIPAEAAFIGDSLSEDIRGTADVGMTTVWIPPDSPSRDVAGPDVVCDSIADLLALPWETS